MNRRDNGRDRRDGGTGFPKADRMMRDEPRGGGDPPIRRHRGHPSNAPNRTRRRRKRP